MNYIITINSVRVYVTGALINQLYSLEEAYARGLASYHAALQTHPHHNYYEERVGANLTGWLTYFLQSMVQEFERVADEVRTYTEIPPQNRLSYNVGSLRSHYPGLVYVARDVDHRRHDAHIGTCSAYYSRSHR